MSGANDAQEEIAVAANVGIRSVLWLLQGVEKADALLRELGLDAPPK